MVRLLPSLVLAAILSGPGTGLAIARTNPPITTAPCIAALLDKALTGYGAPASMLGGYNVILVAGTWHRLMASAVGANPILVAQGAGPKDIELYPHKFDSTWDVNGNPCDPLVLGKMFYVLAHEMLHFVCPDHQVSSDQVNCNNINYALHTASAVCKEIEEAILCNADPACPGIKDVDGNVIPGLERDKLGEYCKQLTKTYKAIQARWNKAANIDAAFACQCPTVWSAGPLYLDCPNMPSPTPTGCGTDASSTYGPDNKIIPDCPGCNG